MEKRRAQGTWSRDPHEYLAELRAVLAKGETVTFTVEGPGGRMISIYNRPMPDGRWVSCHEDVTERRNAEQQVSDQKFKLDAALKNMSQGLCMFDVEGRVAVFNPRYAEMMGVTEEFLSGCTFLELMKRRKALGQFLGDPEALTATVLKAMNEGRGDTRVVERGDGRVHQIVRQPMAGGGWVATLEDITERRIAQERLREQKLQLDAALGNMSQGLCMFNAEGRIVLFNPRYSEIVGLRPDVLQGLSFVELLKRRKAAGDFAGDPEQFSEAVLSAIREGKTITKNAQVRSGRTPPHRGAADGDRRMGLHHRGHHRAAARRRVCSASRSCSSTPRSTTCRKASTCSTPRRGWWCATSAISTCTASRPISVKPGCTVRDLVQARVASGTFFSVDPERYTADLLEHMTKKRTPTSRRAGSCPTAA